MADAPITPRQEELIEHALALVREVGLSGLTVRKLAERVGFSEAALYRHFPSKEELLLTMARRLSEERLLAPIRQLAADRRRPAVERLEAIVSHHVRTVLELDGLPILLLAEAAATGNEELLTVFRRVLDELFATIRAVFEELPGAAGSWDPRLLALALLGAPAATAIRHRLAPDAALEQEAWTELPRLLVRRLLGGPPQGDET